MSEQQPVLSASRLEPLAFHHAIVAYLKQNEAAIWRWIKSTETQQNQAQDYSAKSLVAIEKEISFAKPALCASQKTAGVFNQMT
jgi:hypothetical protein